MTTEVMTDIERIVADWLVAHKIRFQFQTSLSGGYYELGGVVVDFILENFILLRVMGEYFHRGVIPEGKAQVQREQLEAMGWTVIDLWGETILDPNKLDQAMRLALIGQEMLV